MKKIESFKYYTNDNNNFEVICFTDGARYFIITKTYKAHICATRKHGEYQTSYWWNDNIHVFDNKDQANAYFFGIKKNTNITKQDFCDSAEMIDFITDRYNKYITSEERYNDKKKKYEEYMKEHGIEIEDSYKREAERRANIEKQVEQMMFIGRE